VVMDLAVKYRVERFVLVSTDKAVRPTNVMGASKRLAELICSRARERRALYGGALRQRYRLIGIGASLFRRQLEQGGPITVTHPEVTRYFMTIPKRPSLSCRPGAG